MTKFNILYEPGDIFPCTLREVAEDICTQVEVELDSAGFDNQSFIVENNQFEGKTCREVVQDIAKCAFSWARIGQDNKLHFDFQTETEVTESVTPDDYKVDSFKKANEYFGPVNRVIYGQSNITGQEEFVEDAESIAENGLHELIINDNLFAYTTEKRAELVQAGSKLFGLQYMPITQLDCIGLVYLDCRDIINVKDPEENEFVTRVFDHTIKYQGYVNDSIVTEAQTQIEQKYDKVSTHDIMSKVEITVDRHEKNIESLVKDMYEEDGRVSENFTRIYQDITNIVNSVQNSGGSNLLLNSVMFGVDNEGKPSYWTLSETGTIVIEPNTESLRNGCLSGNAFTLSNETVNQTVRVTKAEEGETEPTYYTFSCKVKKNAVGTAYVKIYNSVETHIKEFAAGENAFWKSVEFQGLLPQDDYYTVEFYGDSSSGFTVTDSMLNVGQYKSQWQQASGEVMNTQVNINTNGILVKSSVYEGNYTVMTPLEFAGYSSKSGQSQKVFTLNDDTTEVEKLKVETQIDMPPIKIVPVTTGNNQGWAFVADS